MRRPTPTLLAALALLASPTWWPGSTRVDSALQTNATDDSRRSAPLPAQPAPDPRLTALHGAWELVAVDSPAARDVGFRHSGMMLITDGYLSIELHLGMVETDSNEYYEAYFQSGFHRVHIDPFGQLELVGVLGAEVDEDGVFTFEPPGERRLYRFDLDGERLVLTNLHRQARLTFQRVHYSPPPRDIYGREVRHRPDDEPDQD